MNLPNFCYIFLPGSEKKTPNPENKNTKKEETLQETCYQLIYPTVPSLLPPTLPGKAQRHPPGQVKAAAAGALSQPGWAGGTSRCTSRVQVPSLNASKSH